MKGVEDEMVEWHHRLNQREFEQTLGDGEGQRSLACCSSRGRQESDTTERLNNHRSEKEAITKDSIMNLDWSFRVFSGRSFSAMIPPFLQP